MSALAALTAQRPIRFLAAGAVNTALGLTLFPLLLWIEPWLRTHYLVALGISQALCLVAAFSIHKFAVFRTRGNVVREFGAFASFYVVNYAANWAILPMLVEVGGAPVIPAQVGFTLALIIGSWFWHSRVTFRTREVKR